ncbi:MAG: hypothetical protein AAFQ68_18375, partial [Bacteroidota bacterium]
LKRDKVIRLSVLRSGQEEEVEIRFAERYIPTSYTLSRAKRIKADQEKRLNDWLASRIGE